MENGFLILKKLYLSMLRNMIAVIVYCLYVLAQIDTKGKRKALQTSHYLKAALWKSAHIWVRIMKVAEVPLVKNSRRCTSLMVKNPNG